MIFYYVPFEQWTILTLQSNLIWLIPKHESEPIRNQVFNPDQSESIRARIDPNRIFNENQSKWIRTNPKPSFQSESIRTWIDPNRIFNQNHSDLGFIRIDSDWKFGLDQSELWLIRIDLDWKLDFGLVRIHSDWCLGINRIRSHWFLTVFYETKYKTFFELFRNDSHWLGYRYRNESE